MLGQLYEKIVGPRGQCIKITIILFVVAMMQVATVGAGIHVSSAMPARFGGRIKVS